MRIIGMRVVCSLWLALGMLGVTDHARAQGKAEQSLKCDVGPIQKSYGGTPWLVYSCRDSQALVFVTAPQSPAAPFYFFLYPNGLTFRLTGEGTGNQTLTDAAYNELKSLQADEITALISQTQSVQP